MAKKKHAKPAKPIENRRTSFRETRKVILIVCEGTKTEPSYFEDMGVHLRINAKVEIDGTGRNTLDLVNYANSRKSDDFDEIWCVFDKDDFSDSDFNSALQKARQENINVAYSNESFELWYVLHFNYHASAHKRDYYCKLLTKLMGERYIKSHSGMYQRFLDKLPKAIKHAQKLLKEHESKKRTPAQSNPCTTIHLLVSRLQELAELQSY
jgi:RloB-like protein